MAANRGLGTLTLNVVANIGGFIQGMNSVERAASRTVADVNAKLAALKQGLSKLAGPAQAAGTAIAAGFAIAQAALISMVKAGIEAGDRLDELSARLGISVETLSSLKYAAELSGVSLDDLAGVFPKLSKFMAESLDPASKAASILKTLGLTAVDAAGNLKSPDQMLLELSDKFRQFEDDTGEAALAMQIFGKSGAQLLEFLNRGSEGIKELQERAQSLGLVMSTDVAAKSAEFNDRLGELKSQSEILGAVIGSELLPKISEMILGFQDATKDGKLLGQVASAIGGDLDGLRIAFNLLSAAVSIAETGIGNVITILGALITQSKIVTVTIVNVAKALATLNPKAAFDAVWDGLRATAQNAKNASGEMADAYGRQWTSVAENSNEAWHTLNGTMTESQKKAKALRAEAEKAQEAAYRAANTSYSSNNPYSNTAFGQNQFTTALDKANQARQQAESAAAATNRQVPKSIFTGDDDDKKTKSAKAAKAQLSEEEKAAQKLQERYTSLKEQMQERIAMIGVTTEAGKLQYDLENGELSKLTDLQKTELLNLAKIQDAKNEQYKKDEEARQKQEQEIENMKRISEELLFQQQIIGKTREEQERLALARELGGQAATTEGKAVMAQLEVLQQQQKATAANIELSDEIRQSFVDSFKGIVSGSMSAKDAVLGFLDAINAKILDMIANNWAEKLFGQFGSSMGGSAGNAGGGWLSWFSGLFGGGKAVGGPVSPNTMYRVNENGPELLSVNGKDFLMMGNSGGSITPNEKLGGRGTQVNNFIVQGKIDRRTQQQIAFEAGRAANTATNRNG